MNPASLMGGGGTTDETASGSGVNQTFGGISNTKSGADSTQIAMIAVGVLAVGLLIGKAFK